MIERLTPLPVERVGPHRPDYLLLACTIALLVLGTLMVYSASFAVAHNEFFDDAYFLTRQLASVGVGGACMLLAMRVDYRRLRFWTLLILIVSIALLVLVLVPGLGVRSYGAVRWLKLGPVQVQPSEIAKLALVLYLADWMARRGPRVASFFNGLLPFGVFVGVVAVLVELQPDLGTTAIIVGTAACVFFVAGANLVHITLLGAGGVAAGSLLMVHLSGYRLERIRAFLDPWSDIQGSGWHTAQGLIALGSGGLFGNGLGNGLHKYYWVPNAHTDAIFNIIGEELGFVGCLGVLVLFGILAWRGFLIAWHAPDSFGRLLATGLTCLLTLQALVNVAVVTNSLPYTGITLPFVSYGGSSTVISLIAVGMLLNISRFSGTPREPQPSTQDDPPTESRWEADSPRLHRPGVRRGFHAPTGRRAFSGRSRIREVKRHRV